MRNLNYFMNESLSKKDLKEFDKPHYADCVGWLIGYQGETVKITKEEINDLTKAIDIAVKQLKIPDSKMSLITIKPFW